jgi:hypothetical protein
MLLALLLLPTLAPAAPAVDAFGIAQLAASKPGGMAWAATAWGREPRNFNGQDPFDPWFDCDHGDASYTVDGQGTLYAKGPIVRMYVHAPDLSTEWGPNLEITIYATRLGEDKTVSYSGPQIFARTNHGTYKGAFASELQTLCDDRGLGAKVNLNGTFAFEKETDHHSGNGYATAGAAKRWADGWPMDKTVGLKYLVRDVLDGAGKAVAVKMELWCDETGGAKGGQWQKVTEFTDDGHNFGVGSAPCAPGVDPALMLLRPLMLPASETKRPQLSVYFRHEYGEMAYQRASVREVQALKSSAP